jgi:Animal haem peroxidase
MQDTSGGPPSTSGGGQYDPTGPEITLQSFTKKTDLVHVCGCRNDAFEFDMGDYQALRGLSDRYLAGGRMPSRYGWSNAVWSWGQFIDHDVVATVDDTDGHEFDISMGYGGDSGVMTLHRLVVEPSGQWNGKCRTPPSVISPHVDGSMVYGSDEQYLQVRLHRRHFAFCATSRRFHALRACCSAGASLHQTECLHYPACIA